MDVHNSIVDAHGYTHSVDMVTIDYLLVCSYGTVTQKLIEALEPFGLDKEKNTKLDLLPSFRYAYYTNHVWLDGVVLSLGKWTNYDKADRKAYSLDMMRIKVNPNKHAGTPLLGAVMGILGEYCREGCLVRYDYAIDVPVALGDVLVVSSRKEKGLYKGTRYFGQRHKHGYLKIYDKGLEQHLDMDLTRIEYTLVPDEMPSWDNIVIRAPAEGVSPSSALSSQCRLYLDMLLELRELGADIDPYIERINYRTWKQIEPHLYTGVKLMFDEEINKQLLEDICSMFIITGTREEVNHESPVVDSDGFMTDFGTDLPFD